MATRSVPTFGLPSRLSGCRVKNVIMLGHMLAGFRRSISARGTCRLFLFDLILLRLQALYTILKVPGIPVRSQSEMHESPTTLVGSIYSPNTSPILGSVQATMERQLANGVLPNDRATLDRATIRPLPSASLNPNSRVDACLVGIFR